MGASEYVEIRLAAVADGGEFMARLEETGIEGAWEEGGRLHLCWPSERWDEKTRLGLKDVLTALGYPESGESLEVVRLPDQDWNREWARSIRPIRIGRRVLIRQSWNPAADPGRIVLVLDPKRAFGTGYHATTQLVIEILEERVRMGESILDVGTGSGILAMTALRLGASRALGIDTDPEAVDCARGYARENRFGEELIFRVASIHEIGEGNFGLVTANLDSPTLQALAGELMRRTAENGSVIVSGLRVEDREEIEREFRVRGGVPRASRARDGWMAIEVRK